MFAVIKTGGKQYKVAENDILKVEKLSAEVGATVNIDSVLMVGEGADAKVGAPFVSGASVSAEVIDQAHGPKVTVFKKRRRKHYRRLAGHRQDLTLLRITGISADGKKAPAKRTPATKAGADEAAAASE